MQNKFSVGDTVRVDIEHLKNEVDPESALAWFVQFGNHMEIFRIKKILPNALPQAPIVLDGILSETSFSPDELILAEEEEQPQTYVAVLPLDDNQADFQANGRPLEAFLGLFRNTTKSRLLERLSEETEADPERIRLIQV